MLPDHLLYYLSEYRFFLIFGVILLFGGVRVLLGKKFRYDFLFFMSGGIALLTSIVFLIWGPEINAAYLYRHGLDGTGKVIASRTTSTQINDRDVLAFKTLLRLQNGEVIETEFTSASNNFYPQGEVGIPLPGQEFTMKYAKHKPGNFIILTDDPGSEYGRSCICNAAYRKLFEDEAAFKFDTANAGYRETFKNDIRELQNLPCDSNLKKMYRLQLEKR